MVDLQAIEFEKFASINNEFFKRSYRTESKHTDDMEFKSMLNEADMESEEQENLKETAQLQLSQINETIVEVKAYVAEMKKEDEKGKESVTKRILYNQ